LNQILYFRCNSDENDDEEEDEENEDNCDTKKSNKINNKKQPLGTHHLN
jgi:hypothetical protein